MEECYRERFYYYWRHELYGHSLILCEEAIKSKSTNLILYVWHSLTHGILKNTEIALKEIERISKRSDLILLYKLSQFYIYKSSDQNFEVEIKEIESQITSYLSFKNEFSFINSAFICYLFGDFQLSEKLLNFFPENNQSKAILAFININKNQIEESLEIFQLILLNPSTSYDIFCLYGKSLCFSIQNKLSEALQVHAQIMSRFEFPEIILEKSKIYLNSFNWSLSLNILKENNKLKFISQFEITFIEILNSILHNNNIENCSLLIDKLFEIFKKI